MYPDVLVKTIEYFKKFSGIGEKTAERLSLSVLEMSKEEVKNRLTVTGSLEIGRAPGTITATFLAPVEKLEKIKIYDYVKEQYNLFYNK